MLVWGRVDGIWGLLQGSWGVLVDSIQGCSPELRFLGPFKGFIGVECKVSRGLLGSV